METGKTRKTEGEIVALPKRSLSLEWLPLLVLANIFCYLKHSTLLNLSLGSKRLKSIIDHELEHNKQLWYSLSLKPWMSNSSLQTLKKALFRKAHHVKLIIVEDKEPILSMVVFDFILNFHNLHFLKIESRITIPLILKYFSVFQNADKIKCKNCTLAFGDSLQWIKLVKLNIVVKRLYDTVQYENIVINKQYLKINII